MSKPSWGFVTSDHPDVVLASVALVHEELNPALLNDGMSQDEADKVLSRIAGDIFRAANKASPEDRGTIAQEFAARCISEYADGGHLTQ